MARKKEKKVVLLTGASGGIGTAIADLLLSKNYIVYGTTRSLDGAPEAAYNQVQLDVQDDASVKECVQEVINEEGKIDILINNAGFALCGALKDLSIDLMKDSFETNLFGVHRMNREVIPIMIKQGHGRIIHMGTFGGRIGLPFQGVYSATKASLAVYSEALKIESLRDNVQVSIIEPGDIKTDFHSGRKYSEGFENDPDAQKAVEIMRRDELKGTKPEKVAKLTLKVIKARRLKPSYIMDFKYYFLETIIRMFPRTVRAFVVRLLYGVPKKRKN